MQQILAPKSPGLPFSEWNLTPLSTSSTLICSTESALLSTHCLRRIIELEPYLSAARFHQSGRAVTCAFHHSEICGTCSRVSSNSGVFTPLLEIVGLVEDSEARGKRRRIVIVLLFVHWLV